MKHKHKNRLGKMGQAPTAQPRDPIAASHEIDGHSQLPLLAEEGSTQAASASPGDVLLAEDDASPVSRFAPSAPVELATQAAPDDSGDILVNPAGERDDAMPRNPDSRGTSLGVTLRDARDARGWTQADVGARLKLPIRLIDRIERNDYAGMTQGVYLRGYLTSYARLLDLPVSVAEQVANERVEAAPLVATGTTSHSRYLFDRYSVSATYLILTALIVAPAVWLATHGGLEQNLARNLPLDGALVALDDAMPGAALVTDANVDATPSRRTIAVDPPPIISSIASFPTLRAAAPASGEVSVPQTRAPELMPNGHNLTLRLTEESWVEVLDAEGNRIEYGLLPAGIERSYEASGPLSVHLGNADGATVIADGEIVDLAPFRRANVVRLSVFDAESGSDTPSAH